MTPEPGQAVLPRLRPRVGLRRQPPRASTRCRLVLLSSKLITGHVPCVLRQTDVMMSITGSGLLGILCAQPGPFACVGLPKGTQAGSPDKWPTPQSP